MNADFDAIAVGGGLAGCAFALSLAHGGKRVALIERSANAQLKVCGDFLSREAQELLLSIGVDVYRLGAQRISQFKLACADRAALAPLPFAAAGLSRFLLDETVLDCAKASNVEVIRGERVTELDLSGSLPLVVVGNKRISARNIGLATGKYNLRGFQRTLGRQAAYKMTFELSKSAQEALEDVVQLVSYRGGYIGACNIEGGASTLCWLADKNLLVRSGGDWQKQLSDLAGRSRHLEFLVADAKPLFDKPATVSGLPFGYKRRAAVHRNVYAVGDQIAVIPSFTGDGTSIAISSGISAARAILNGLGSGEYHLSFLKRLSAQFRWAKVIDFTFKTEFTRRLNVEAISVLPSLATLMTYLTRLPDGAEK